jgi:hypothetical protein
MNTKVNLTLEGKFTREINGNLHALWDCANIIIDGNHVVSEITIDPHYNYENPEYRIVWDNCDTVFFFGDTNNPSIHLDVTDDSKPVHFSYYHGDELLGSIEIDPLHNNGVTISGNDTVYDTNLKAHSVFGELDNIGNVIHVNPLIL